MGESDIIGAIKGKYNYNSRSRVNHVKTFKNTPKMFKIDMADTEKKQIGSEYISHTDPKIDTITVKP